MEYQVKLDEALRPGITAARLARNASLPQTVQNGTTTVPMLQGTDEEGEPVLVDREVPNMVPNPDLIATDEGYMVWMNVQAARSYNKQHGTVTTPSPEPQGGGSGQVLEVRKWQALIGLQRDGIKQQVLDFIATLSEEAQAFWEGSTAIERSSPLFAAAKQHFGWSDAVIDDMFNRYSRITAADITG